MIAVFLNNKLISCDSVLPLLYEAKESSKKKDVEFYCFDMATMKAIRENVVMNDVINRIGKISCLSRKSTTVTGKALERCRTLFLVMRLAVLAIISKATFIHFKALNNYPWRVLFFLNRNRTILAESSAIGFTPREDRLMEIQGSDQTEPQYIAASRLISFHETWKVLKAPVAKILPVYNFGSPRERRHWLSFVRSEANQYFEKEFESLGIEEVGEVAVYILGYLGPVGFMKSPESMKTLLHDTLSVMSDLEIDIPIMIKPHSTTDQEYVKSVIKQYPNLNIFMTGLHPAVLATRARFFVANYYSNTFYDAYVMGAPTIEYTEYSDAISQAMGDESIRPEYVDCFIQRSPEKLNETLRGIQTDRKARKVVGKEDDDSGILRILATA